MRIELDLKTINNLILTFALFKSRLSSVNKH
ncbi:hypothetical protein DFQ11_10554 [Winogradskyella epiphytica]|uniref:Uncharacterized protein n=1 Tax=Winogradskyella epiphytica TaxID=262005 RepID=A0A2V4YBK8_9FLAO|nr:hypothetical protein DFQ11_10554 [Winogradskyella epiphytica]